MITAALFSVLLGQTPAIDPSRPYRVESTVRLALTPKLDGMIEPEEWDPLGSDGIQSFFQWEPDVLYWAATAGKTEDIVVSLDTQGDGWLNGKDNLEIRYKAGPENRIVVRTLDCTDGNGPQWRDGGVLPESIKMAASMGERWSVESSFTPRLGVNPKAGSKMAIRIDAVPAGTEVSQPYQPRSLALLMLQLDSSRNLPAGISWRPNMVFRSIAREDRLKIEFNLQREEGDFVPQRIEMRGEGLARTALAEISQPFPALDSKGRTSSEFTSVISPNAEPGWRVVRGTVKDKAGQEFQIRSSVKLSYLLDYEFNFQNGARSVPDAQIVKGNVTLRSQANGRIEGVFGYDVPAEWTITKGKTTKILIHNSRGVFKVPIEFIIPKNTQGTFPLHFKVTIGSQVIEKTLYFPVE